MNSYKFFPYGRGVPGLLFCRKAQDVWPETGYNFMNYAQKRRMKDNRFPLTLDNDEKLESSLKQRLNALAKLRRLITDGEE